MSELSATNAEKRSTNTERTVCIVLILLAEDNPLIQKITARLIEKIGHQVVVAPDGREALKRFSENRFDLVLMDVQMPEMDGLAAAAAIRRQEKDKGGHLPIIALTAHDDAADHQRCLDAGMDDCWVKPLTPNALKDMLGRWVVQDAESE